jgi:D-alanyl-lipoteichoic acid acyltransferase DltB (MBOAT superfamily)
MWWIPKYVLVILASIAITYVSGLLIGMTESKSRKKLYVALSVVLNVVLLGVFKYFNFFNESITWLLKQINLEWGVQNLSILLPIGISFYTFKALSYTIDVYKGAVKPEKNFLTYALFVSFFPQLITGPIERGWHLLPQFYEDHNFDYQRVSNGFKLMAWGFFKKAVIADKCGIFIDGVYNNLQAYHGLPLILATWLYVIQIYCDLSGYTDIAIGAADVLGFKTIKNFNRPLFSKSIVDLWRRWHMSMMSWFRDYLYIPLGGNRVSKTRHYFNTIVTFTVSGFWHSANWTFIIWGFINGILIIISTNTRGIRDRIRTMIGLEKFPVLKSIWQIAVTIFIFGFGAVLFRARNIGETSYIVKNLLNGLGGQLLNITSFKMDIGMSWGKATIMIISIIILIAVEFLQRKGSVREMISKKPVYIRFSAYYILLLWILIFGEFGSKSFIYFQF